MDFVRAAPTKRGHEEEGGETAKRARAEPHDVDLDPGNALLEDAQAANDVDAPPSPTAADPSPDAERTRRPRTTTIATTTRSRWTGCARRRRFSGGVAGRRARGRPLGLVVTAGRRAPRAEAAAQGGGARRGGVVRRRSCRRARRPRSTLPSAGRAAAEPRHACRGARAAE